MHHFATTPPTSLHSLASLFVTCDINAFFIVRTSAHRSRVRSLDGFTTVKVSPPPYTPSFSSSFQPAFPQATAPVKPEDSLENAFPDDTGQDGPPPEHTDDDQPPAFNSDAAAPPFEGASSSSTSRLAAETKAVLPRDLKESAAGSSAVSTSASTNSGAVASAGPRADVKGATEKSNAVLDDGEPPPPYTEGSSPLESFTYIMGATGGPASIITQVAQGGGAPVGALTRETPRVSIVG